MDRRDFLAVTAATAGTALAGCATDPARSAPALQRIAFGSCADQTKPQPIWDMVANDRPGLVIFGGDNVYASQQPWSLERLEAAYAQQAAVAPFSHLRATVPHLAIWDDHDYGLNDGGADFAQKQQAKDAFLRFWQLPEGDPRRTREGLYHAQLFGPPGRRVQVIVLDTRWFRSPLLPTDQRGAPGKERWLPDPDPAKTMLGEVQWAWLEQQLREPAQVRLVYSSIQVLAEGHGFERWGNLPAERARLLRLVGQTGARGVVFLSGDRHVGAMYREMEGMPYPMHEVTSSGITHPWADASEPGPNRLGPLVTVRHYGLVEIDWLAGVLRLSLKDEQGATRQWRDIAFDMLRIPTT